MLSAAEMSRTLRGTLVCPTCLSSLEERSDQYTCGSCGGGYPIENGIPRFVPSLSADERQVQSSFDLEHRRWRDSRYLYFGPELVKQWLEEIKLPAEYFRGKLVLDAGCGSGRWTYAMASLGARVIAMDLTDGGVEETRRATAAMDNVSVIQASVFHPPFRPETFDLVVSWGVLHHTPNTHEAFRHVAPLVRRGGQLYVMIYEKHNPVKYAVTDAVRWCLRRLPPSRRYRACRLLIIKNRLLYRWLAHCLICAPHPRTENPLDVTTLQFGLYDAYAPVFNHLHTRREVAGWFDEFKFGDPFLTRPVRHTARRAIVLHGECGGSINMRGTRL